jgi:hypothetical protein
VRAASFCVARLAFGETGGASISVEELVISSGGVSLGAVESEYQLK